MTTSPTSAFRLTLPEHWFDCSVADEAQENAIAARTWDNCRAAGLDDRQAGAFTDSVRRAVRQARRSGVVHAGGTVEFYDDGPLTATVLVAALHPPAAGDVLGALLSTPDSGTASGTWYRLGTVVLPHVGVAARVQGVQDVTLDGETMRCVLMHTVLRIPGSPEILVVTGSSPNLAAADELFELFAAITATLRFTTAVGGHGSAADSAGA